MWYDITVHLLTTIIDLRKRFREEEKNYNKQNLVYVHKTTEQQVGQGHHFYKRAENQNKTRKEWS